MTQASAVMRAEGWPDQHLREVPGIGRRSWRYRTLGPAVDGWAAVVCKERVGPLGTRGMRAHSGVTLAGPRPWWPDRAQKPVSAVAPRAAMSSAAPICPCGSARA